MSARRVIVLRHGRTGHNHSGTWQGQLDVPLDEVGRAQASAAARALHEVTADGGAVRIVSSDLSRAQETAEALAARLGAVVTLDPRLREIDAGRWQGLTRAEIAAAGMGDELEAWLHGEDVRVGGGERRSEAATRCSAALREHAQALESGTLVAVAHGGVLRGSIVALLGLPPGHWHLLGVLGNAHWGELTPGQAPAAAWRLLSYNTHAAPANRFEVPPPAQGRLAEPQR